MHLAGHEVHIGSEVIVSFQRLRMIDKIGDVYRWSGQRNVAQARVCPVMSPQ